MLTNSLSQGLLNQRGVTEWRRQHFTAFSEQAPARAAHERTRVRCLLRKLTITKTPQSGALVMVSPRGFRWNTLTCKLESLDKKLEELGLIDVNGEIVYEDMPP